MKILFATAERHPTFRPDVAVLFGKYLPRHGIHSDLATLTVVPRSLAPWGAGRVLGFLAPGNRIFRHIASLLNDLRLLYLCRRGYDAIQVRDKPLAALIGLIAARLAGLRFYYWMSFPMPESWLQFARERRSSLGLLRWLFTEMRGRVTFWLLYAVVLPRADHVFVQTERMRSDVAAHGIDPDRMTPVPMGVDMERTGEVAECGPSASALLKHLAGRRVVVYIGTLDRARHLEVVIDAIDQVRRTFPEVLLVLIGSSAEARDRTFLEQVTRDKGLDHNVCFAGWLSGDDVWTLARCAEVGVSPIPRGPIFDCGSPTKAAEYLAIGLPVVVNDQPDQVRVIAASGGGLCVPHTAEGFADGIVSLLRDREGGRQMGRRGREWIRANRSYAVLAELVARRYLSVASNAH